MADTATDVLVAGYQEIATATEDFESLAGRVENKRLEVDGVIVAGTTETATNRCATREITG